MSGPEVAINMGNFSIFRLIVLNPIICRAFTSLLYSTRCSLRILLLHHVAERHYRKLRRWLNKLSRNYRFVAPDFIPAFLSGNRNVPNRKYIAISFDDGFKSQLKVAQKVLEPSGAKALFFVLPSYINMQSTGEKFDFLQKNLRIKVNKNLKIYNNWLPMKWEDVRYLASKGHTIGSHTLSHPMLSSIRSEQQLNREINRSKKIIEKQLDLQVHWFAYPFGNNKSISPLAYRWITSAYRFCCTGLRGSNLPSTSAQYLCRDSIDLHAPEYYLNFIVAGGVDWLYQYKMKQLLIKTNIPF
jgi:peptidoglycan/xylan/chitin deacetylase (PgdA/CDA1 family)